MAIAQRLLARLVFTLFSVACDDSNTIIDCGGPIDRFVVVPEGTQSLSVEGDSCSAGTLIECGTQVKRIEQPAERCEKSRFVFEGDRATCELVYSAEDGTETRTEFTYDYLEDATCPDYRLDFADEGAALMEAGVELRSGLAR